MKRRDPSAKSAFKLIDDASAAIQYNRDLLQTALDQVAQGIAVFDRDLRLVCWNRQFRILLRLPDELSQVGTPLDAIIRQIADLGAFGRGEIDQGVAERIARMAGRHDAFREVDFQRPARSSRCGPARCRTAASSPPTPTSPNA